MKTFSKTIANFKTPLGEFPSLSKTWYSIACIIINRSANSFSEWYNYKPIQTLLNDPLSDCPSAHLLHMLSQYKREMHGSLGVQKTS